MSAAGKFLVLVGLVMWTVGALADVGNDPPKKDVAPNAVKPGIYHIQGTDAEDEYQGALVLRQTGESTFELHTSFQTVGLGIRHGRTLSVAYGRIGGGVTSSSVYLVGADGKLEGFWTGGAGKVYPETLTFIKELKK